MNNAVAVIELNGFWIKLLGSLREKGLLNDELRKLEPIPAVLG